MKVFLVLCLLAVTVSAAPRKVKNWDQLEQEWAESDEEDSDDEPVKKEKDDEGNYVHQQPKTKTEMAFVSLKKDKVTEKNNADFISKKFQNMLTASGIEATVYKIDTYQVLVTAYLGAKSMVKIKKFVLKQEETEKFTWNSKDAFPGDEEGLDPTAMGLGLKTAMKPELLDKLKAQGIRLPGMPVSAKEARAERQYKKQQREAKKEAKRKADKAKIAEAKKEKAERKKVKGKEEL